MKRILISFLAVLMLALSAFPLSAAAEEADENAGSAAEETAAYTLDKVVVLSRHGIRSPTGDGSLLEENTPHSWFSWTSAPGELSLRGAREADLLSRFGEAIEAFERLPEEFGEPEAEAA